VAAWFRSMLIEDESSGKKNGYDARAANQVVEATSGFGPSVWTGRALQAESDDLEKLVLRICIRPIHGAFELLAIMDIRACSISFASRPRRPEGPPDHERAGETFLHRLISTRRPRWES
jgi:hypothetical protein